MSTSNQQSSGAASDQQSGAPGGDQGHESTDTRTTVSFEDHQRALKDLHRFKSRAKELEDAIANKETQSLREKEDYKTLADRYKAELDETQNKLKSINQWFESSQAHSSVKQHALRLGLLPEAEKDLDLLPLEGVVVETVKTSSGGVRHNVLGADGYVESLKKTRPHWFRDTKAPVFNSGSGIRPEVEIEMSGKKLADIEAKHGRNSKEWKEGFEALRKSKMPK
jgi:hypothetical protein